MVLLSNHLPTHPHLVVFYSFAECEPLSSSQQVGNSPTHDHLQHIQGTLVMTAMMLRSLTGGGNLFTQCTDSRDDVLLHLWSGGRTDGGS